MKKVQIEVKLTEEELRYIRAVVDGSDWGEKEGEFCTHGTLDMNRLVQMLLQDVAYTVSRPGSWEGSNMLKVLTSHGYENTRFSGDPK